jgi:exopolyphosphatase/guanosine-5'-triphosphate,3'-diphosphate pyrophosphatase
MMFPKHPRLATIDIGTNSVLLLIVAQTLDDKLQTEHERCTITRLGQEVDRTGVLREDAKQRTLEELQQCALLLEEHGVGERRAIGTSALRDARNASCFISEAETILGCPIEVVSGMREAELVVRGVQSGLGAISDRSVIFDVGGGSTELIYWRQHCQPTLVSLDLGSVRLTERHLRSPRLAVPAHEVMAMEEEIISVLGQLPQDFLDISELIGIAGTVTTLAAMEQGLTVYDSNRIDGCELTLAQIQRHLARLASLPLSERQRIAGLEPARADIIIAGALIVKAIFNRVGLAACRVSTRGVRWGLVHEMKIGKGR